MQKIIQTIQSRTFWTIAFMVILAGIQSFGHFIPTDLYVAINTFLGGLGVIFHVYPSQDYSSTAVVTDNVKTDSTLPQD